MAAKNLVIVRAGNSSLHPEWLKGDGNRNWDIVVNYFGDNPELYKETGVTRIDSKGPKWPALHDLISSNPQFISDYEYIWLPDDDLLATKSDINRLFNICAEYGLEAAQPALTWDSYYSYVTTLRNAVTKIRYTNMIEIMAPCFSSSLLRKGLPFFDANLSGWGLDYIWSRLADDPVDGIAIIDTVAVRHTRPVGGPNYKHLQKKGVAAKDEARAFCLEHGIGEEPEIATHKVILRNGTTIQAKNFRRMPLLYVLGFLPAVWRTHERWHLLRRVAGMTAKAMLNMPDKIAEKSIW
jgi:hypothetical protein